MHSNPQNPLLLQLSLLISSLTSKKALKKSKSDLFYLLSVLGPHSESIFLITLLQQISISELKEAIQEDAVEKPSRVKAVLFIQRLEKIQDSLEMLDVFPDVFEDFAVARHLTQQDAVVLISECFKISIKLELIMIFSVIFTGSYNPPLLEMFLAKLSEYFSKEDALITYQSLFPRHFVEFLRSSPLISPLRLKLPELSTESPDKIDEQGLLIEESPHFKKFLSLDFCLQPHEILQEFTGNPLEITKIYHKNTFNDDEMAECLGSISKTYPVLEDSTQRLVNKLFETQGNLENFGDKSLEKKTVNFNLEAFMKHFADLGIPIKPVQILQSFDRKGFRKLFQDPKTFANLLKTVQRFRKIYNTPFPVFLLFSRWQHPHSQTQFLISLFTCAAPEMVSWQEIQHKRLISLDFNPALRYQSLTPASLHFWCCLDLLEMLIECSETEHFLLIRALFEQPIGKAPDILVVGLSQIKPKCGFVLLEELFSSLFPLYLLNHSNSVPILEALWKYNEPLMIEAIFSLYRKENSSLNLSRVLDITQEIKDSLIPLTNCGYLSFSVSLGILASKREFLHFEHWLNERLKAAGNPFITVLLKYIEETVLFHCEVIEKTPQNPHTSLPALWLSTLEKAQLSLETLGIMMESLLGSGFDRLTLKNQKKAQEVFAGVCKYFPPLAGVHESAKLEIENAANMYFQRYYYKEMRIDEFVELLNKLKSSNNPSEKEIHACMLHYLFDEFRHHDEYTPEILLMTGTIFGTLINSKLLDNSPLLEMALQCIRYCLEKGSSRRLEFAKEALSCFRRRCFELFDFFQSLFYLDNIKDKLSDFLYDLFEDSKKAGRAFDIKPDLLYFLQVQKNSLLPKPQIQPQEKKNPTVIVNSSVFQPKTVNLSTLPLQYPAKIQIPSNEPSINILEFINRQNEDPEPIEEELMNQLTFHLNSLCANNLQEKAIELRKVLEKSENAQKWLARTLVFKRVIQETLTKNNYLQLLMMLAIRPLYKIVLRETYSCIHKLLSLQVSNHEKAAIQVKNFLKNLGFWLGHLTLARNKPIILKSLNLKVLLNEALISNRLQLIVPFICKIMEASKNSEVFDLNNPWIKGILGLLNEILKSEDVKQTLKQEIKLLFNSLELEGKTLDKPPVMPIVESFVPPVRPNPNPQPQETGSFQVNSSLLTRFIQKIPNIREIAQKVVEKSVVELLNPVIARTVTIAMITGKKLSGKDFALDFSDQRLERGTGLIVQSLAHSLALATAKEPLKTSIQSGLFSELRSHPLPLSEQELEELLECLLHENFDRAVGYIQQKVVEKAVQELNQDSDLREGLSQRKGGAYHPEDAFLRGLEQLPVQLRPTNKGLSEEEFRVYEDFNREEGETIEGIGEKNAALNWLAMVQGLDPLIDDLSDNDLMGFMGSFNDFVAAAAGEGILGEALCAEFTKNFMGVIVNRGKRIDPLVKAVQTLAQGQHKRRVEKEIKGFLTGLGENVLCDHAKFNENLLLSLFNAKLLNEKSLDKVCGSLLKRPLANVQNSVVKTLSLLIFNSKQISPKDCLLSSVSLGNIEKSSETVMKFLENLNKFSSFTLKTNKKAEIIDFLEKKTSFHEKIIDLFQKFLMVHCKKVNNVGFFGEVMAAMESLMFGENEETSLRTMAVLLDLVIYHSGTSSSSLTKLGVFDLDYTLLDAYLALFQQLFARLKDKTRLYELFLDSFEAVLTLAHRRTEPSFNQRPFLRVLRVFIEDFSQNDLAIRCFCLVKKMLDVSPEKFPGFVVAWIEMLGHHKLVPSLLGKEELQYAYHLLLVELMRFFRRLDDESRKTVVFKTCYLATLKIMLVLLHDFPEFLAFFSVNLCNEIPESFIQLRNIILAAFPKNMRLIDPFQVTDVNKIESFKEMPRVFFKDFEEKIAELGLHVDIMEYMNGRKEGIVGIILEKLRTIEGQTDVHAISAFAIGVPWILYSKQSKMAAHFQETKIEAENLLIQTIKKAGFEIREVLLNSIMNQIRYPNLLSQFFIGVVLGVFNERGLGVLHEQMARVIVERLIIEKPHPWGLMFTFIELIRNRGYCFKEIFSESLFTVIIQRIFNSMNIS